MVKVLKRAQAVADDFPAYLWEPEAWRQFIDQNEPLPDFLLGKPADDRMVELYERMKARGILEGLQWDAMKSVTTCPPCCNPNQFIVAHGFKWNEIEQARAKGLGV